MGSAIKTLERAAISDAEIQRRSVYHPHFAQAGCEFVSIRQLSTHVRQARLQFVMNSLQFIGQEIPHNLEAAMDELVSMAVAENDLFEEEGIDWQSIWRFSPELNFQAFRLEETLFFSPSSKASTETWLKVVRKIHHRSVESLRSDSELLKAGRDEFERTGNISPRLQAANLLYSLPLNPYPLTP